MATAPSRGLLRPRFPARPAGARLHATSTRTAARSRSPRSSSGCARSASRRPGRTSGSARGRTATSRPPASTPPAASSTSTTRIGAPGATPRSSTRCSPSPRTCRRCARAWRPGPGVGAGALTRERVLACAVRLLDRGFFRIGTEEYADANESFGLATMRKEHVQLEDDDTMVFDYPAKSRQAPGARGRGPGRRSRSSASSSAAAAAARSCSPTSRAAAGATSARATSTSTSRRSPAPTTPPRTSGTWNATVLAAVALAVSGEVAGTKTGRKRAISARGQGGRALPRQHAGGLPRLLHRPAGLRRLRGRPHHPPGARGGRRGGRRARWRSTTSPQLERAVLDLIDEREAAPGVEKLAA